MFAGIVEAKSPILSSKTRDQVIEIQVQRPANFDDIKVGDSIAVNGVCLTVEDFTPESLQFAIGHETMRVTAWQAENLENLVCNLERSLRLGDRIHGHLMSGHVEGLGKVAALEKAGENLLLYIQIPESFAPLVWNKGGLCVQGVSLTVNEIKNHQVSICLIPETLRQTNLANLQVGDSVNLEADYFAKAMRHFWELKNASH
tara:strand:- start:6802 stop:7407 length:606 start_codon:yes stop_codon:yes gene_type:complete